MPVNYSVSQMTSLLSRETDDIPVILATLSHPELPENIRISTDNGMKLGEDENGAPYYGTISNGKHYVFCPVAFELPSGHGEERNTASITIDNASRELIPFIRKAQIRDGRPKVQFQIILLSPDDPESADDVLADYPELEMTSIEYSQMSIKANLAVASLEGEAFPGKTFMPTMFPSLFGVVK